jgi:hypothetical protein
MRRKPTTPWKMARTGVVNIQVRIRGENLEQYRQELLRLGRTLRRLERESPFTFTIIGKTGFSASKIRMVRKPSFRDVSSVLNPAHQDIYTANPRGQAFRQRVDAARGPIQTLREQAVRQFVSKQKGSVKTRLDAKREFAIAKALFSPGFIIQ